MIDWAVWIVYGFMVFGVGFWLVVAALVTSEVIKRAESEVLELRLRDIAAFVIWVGVPAYFILTEVVF